MGKLQGVSDTLFIPLAARIFVSKKFPEYFFDEKALSLEKYIPDNNIQKKPSEYSFMASAARYYNLDSMVRAFIRAVQKPQFLNSFRTKCSAFCGLVR